MKLEVVGSEANQNEALWVRHPDKSLQAFSQDQASGLWTAALSEKVGDNISKVQFCGQLDVLDMDLQHVDVIT